MLLARQSSGKYHEELIQSIVYKFKMNEQFFLCIYRKAIGYMKRITQGRFPTEITIKFEKMGNNF